MTNEVLFFEEKTGHTHLDLSENCLEENINDFCNNCEEATCDGCINSDENTYYPGLHLVTAEGYMLDEVSGAEALCICTELEARASNINAQALIAALAEDADARDLIINDLSII